MQLISGFIALCCLCCLLPYPAGAAPKDTGVDCAELAERKAAQQYVEDSAALEDRRSGGFRDSALRRDLLRLEAESYRARVYRECLRQRSRSEAGDPSPPAGD